MRPQETPHTSTPIAGAQTSQAHTPSQDHEPPAASPCGWPRSARGSPAALPVAGTGIQPAWWGANWPRRGCWCARATGQLQHSHGAEALAISADLLQADTVLGDGIAAASASPGRPACEPTRTEGLLRGYQHQTWTPRSSPHSRTTQPPSFTAACQEICKGNEPGTG